MADSMNRIRKYYGTMSKGEKVYMANKLLKEDGIVAQKVEDYVPQEVRFPQPAWVTPQRGTRWTNGVNEYILASTGVHRLSLINIDTGRQFMLPVEVAERDRATKSEWKRITNGEKTFTQVSKEAS